MLRDVFLVNGLFLSVYIFRHFNRLRNRNSSGHEWIIILLHYGSLALLNSASFLYTIHILSIIELILRVVRQSTSTHLKRTPIFRTMMLSQFYTLSSICVNGHQSVIPFSSEFQVSCVMLILRRACTFKVVYLRWTSGINRGCYIRAHWSYFLTSQFILCRCYRRKTLWLGGILHCLLLSEWDRFQLERFLSTFINRRNPPDRLYCFFLLVTSDDLCYALLPMILLSLPQLLLVSLVEIISAFFILRIIKQLQGWMVQTLRWYNWAEHIILLSSLLQHHWLLLNHFFYSLGLDRRHRVKNILSWHFSLLVHLLFLLSHRAESIIKCMDVSLFFSFFYIIRPEFRVSGLSTG